METVSLLYFFYILTFSEEQKWKVSFKNTEETNHSRENKNNLSRYSFKKKKR